MRASKKKESGRRQTSWTRSLAAAAAAACQHPRGGRRRSKEPKVRSCICLGKGGGEFGSALTPATSTQTRSPCSAAIRRYVGRRREHLVAIPGYGSPHSCQPQALGGPMLPRGLFFASTLRAGRSGLVGTDDVPVSLRVDCTHAVYRPRLATFIISRLLQQLIIPDANTLARAKKDV